MKKAILFFLKVLLYKHDVVLTLWYENIIYIWDYPEKIVTLIASHVEDIILFLKLIPLDFHSILPWSYGNFPLFLHWPKFTFFSQILVYLTGIPTTFTPWNFPLISSTGGFFSVKAKSNTSHGSNIQGYRDKEIQNHSDKI